MHTASVKITFDGEIFRASCHFDARHIVDAAGFRFHEERKFWYTELHRVAARLSQYADDKAKNEIYSVMLDVTPWEGALPHPQNLKPVYYQPIAARFALSRNRSYLAMDPGLGKTPTVCLMMNALHSKRPRAFIYMCPSFLVRNVENEIDTWCPHLGVEHFREPEIFSTSRVLIVPDSLMHRENFNKDIAYWLLDRVPHHTQTVLIVDECHRFKNPESARTRSLLGHTSKTGKVTPAFVDMFNRVVYMSGTPMPNRPAELYPILSKSAHETIDFMTFPEYGDKFCAGRYNKFGKEFTGASNIRELAAKVQGTFMFRLRKDALKLPPLLEELLIVADDQPKQLAEFDHALLKQYSPEDLMQAKISAQYQFQDMHLMTYQRLLGLEKVPHAVTFLDDLMSETDENILVFCKHKDVIAVLAEKLKKYDPSVITGQTKTEDRYDIVQDFQNNKSKRILIGNLKAMGVGFNLTKATRVLIVEPDWTPSTNDQARDRAHRYGQTNSVLVQYLVYKNSVDRRVLDVVLKKRKLGTYI